LVEVILMAVHQFTVIIEPDEDVFHAFVPALPGCHTFGATVEEAQNNIAEAITLHIESMQEDGELVPVEREPLFITRLSVPMAA
jgi:predicted RNase H-like HicB family nuclease